VETGRSLDFRRFQRASVFFHAFAQCLLGDAEHAGGDGLIAVGPFHGLRHQKVRGLFDGREFSRKDQPLLPVGGAVFLVSRDQSLPGSVTPDLSLEDLQRQDAVLVPAGGVEQQRFQFADIAGKRVVPKQGDELLRRARRFFVQRLGGLFQKVRDQQRQIVQAVSQGGT
jgi:hypothetical protein